jgi:ABC-type Zn uptake system ZnuABC Zn-binding protein ZnuA
MAQAKDLVSNTKEIAATNTPEQLTTSTVVTAVLVRALKGNAANVHIGPSTVGASSYELEPGEAVAMHLIDLAKVYVYGKEKDKVQYIGLTP